MPAAFQANQLINHTGRAVVQLGLEVLLNHFKNVRRWRIVNPFMLAAVAPDPSAIALLCFVQRGNPAVNVLHGVPLQLKQTYLDG